MSPISRRVIARALRSRGPADRG